MKYLASALLSISLIFGCDEEGQKKDKESAKCNNAALYKFYSEDTEKIFNKLGDDFVEVAPIASFENVEGYPQIGDPFDKIIIRGTFPDVNKNEYMFNPAKLKEIADKNNQKLGQEYFDKLGKMAIATGFFFHGSGKSPAQMKARDGLCNSPKNVDLGSYYEPKDTRGFISFTRSPTLAKRHGQVNFETKKPREKGGWVYVAFINGGYLDPILPLKLKMMEDPKPADPIYSRWQDQEVSQFEGVPWKFFVAYRKVTKKGKFEGPVFIRDGLDRIQPEAYKKIVASLSGAELVDSKAVKEYTDLLEQLNGG